METKFKVGDKVRVKSLEWYNNNKNIDGDIIAKEGNKFGVFKKYMRPWCGDVIKINSVINGSYRANNRWFWYDWMLEDEPVTEEKQEVEQLNKNDMETKEMTKAEVFAYLDGAKIICLSTQETINVQKKLFELGIEWDISGKGIDELKFLLIIEGKLLKYTLDIDYWVRNIRYKQIEPSEILAIQIKEEKPKFNPKTLQPFDKVLVRDSDEDYWEARFFDSYGKAEYCEPYYTTNGCSYVYCIPYNEETKNLHGTIKEAPEYYQIWKK